MWPDGIMPFPPNSQPRRLERPESHREWCGDTTFRLAMPVLVTPAACADGRDRTRQVAAAPAFAFQAPALGEGPRRW